MEHIFLKARAKINIALDVLGKREDGYHEMSMVMQTINLYDTLFMKKIPTNEILMDTNIKFLPTNEKNLAYQAVELMRARFGIDTGVYVDLKKNIPIAAGLAGGSSDCAAALMGMRSLFEIPVSKKELMTIGKELGADVPFCILRGTALAEGIGEKLTVLPPHPQVHILVVKPPINVSTATVFQEFRLSDVGQHPPIDEIITELRARNIIGIADCFFNVLESVTEKKHPIISELKKIMMQHHAVGALMSGSGSTVFGYYQNKKNAIDTIRFLRKNYKEIREVYLTDIFNPPRRNGSYV